MTCILTVLTVVQPKQARDSYAVTKLMTYDAICPEGDIYRGDKVFFGGTIYNNHTEDQELLSLVTRVYGEENRSLLVTDYEYQLGTEEYPIILEINEAKTVTFSVTIGDELEGADNYTFMMFFVHQDVDTTTEVPDETQIGNNFTVNILLHPPEAPLYIWAVLAVLLGAIIALIVVAIVSRVREKRAG